MRIGINLLCILPGVNGGVETYARSLVNALIEQDRQNEYVIFANREGARLKLKEASNVKLEVCDFDAQSRELRYAWEQILLPLQFYRLRIDVAHSVGYQGPIFCPCPSVVTIPDLNFIACGDTMKFRRRAALRFFSTSSARRAARVITISQFSKDQIAQYLDLPASRVRMIHLGPGLQPPPEDWDVVQAKHGLNTPYIVAFAGNNHPHKNLPALLAALRQVRNRAGIGLAIIGRLSADLRALAQDALGQLFDLGFVPDTHIGPILSHAQLCVLPSLYEGFGLPVLEAQTAGVPLACSNAGSLPEIAGQGACYFDPRSVEGMISAIDRCLSDPAFCRELVSFGRENLKRFSWERTAAETLAVYGEAAKLPKRAVDACLDAT
jgi:glycosyltransferase involved in cell wall biosynthesis